MATFGVPSWRDEEEEDLLGGGMNGQTPAGGAAASAFGDGEVPNFAPAAAPKPVAADAEPFNLSNTELFKQASKTALDQLGGNVPGWNEQAGEARDAFGAAQAQNQAGIRDQLMGLGLRDSGTWAQEGIVRSENDQTAQRNEFERGLIADRAKLAREQQTAGNTAIVNLMGLQQEGEIAQATLGQDSWKTLRAEELTKAGWDFEAAQGQIAREWEGLQADMDRVLQREVEAGRMTLEQAKLAETVRQFNTEDEWNRYALAQNLTMEQAKMAWQSGERIANQAFQGQEATLDRQLQREVEEGRLTLEQTKLAQQAAQFDTQLEWEKEATRLGLSMDEAKMLWQTGESAKDRAAAAQLQLAAQEFELRGMNLTAVLGYLQTMDPSQAATVFNQLAVDAGLTYTDANGAEQAGLKPIVYKTAGTGAVGTAAGASVANLVAIGRAAGILSSPMDDWVRGEVTAGRMTETEAGNYVARAVEAVAPYDNEADWNAHATTVLELTPAQARLAWSTKNYGTGENVSAIQTAIDTAADKLSTGQTLSSTEWTMLAEAARAGINTGLPVAQALPAGDVTRLVGKGESGWQRYALSESAKTWATANEGGLFINGNNVYQVVGSWDPPNDSDNRYKAGYITFRDVKTGQTYNLSTGGAQARNAASLVSTLP